MNFGHHWTRREILALFGAAGGAFVVAGCTTTLVSGTPTASSTETRGGPGGGGPGGNEDEALAEEFIGITTDGTVIPDLFTIQATDVSTEPIRTAAETFLASLSNDQRTNILFPIDDDEWRMWSNVDGYGRQGVNLEEMSEGTACSSHQLVDRRP